MSYYSKDEIYKMLGQMIFSGEMVAELIYASEKCGVALIRLRDAKTARDIDRHGIEILCSASDK